MNENDYLNATNLTKARIAKDVIADMLFIKTTEDKKHRVILRKLNAIIASLEEMTRHSEHR